MDHHVDDLVAELMDNAETKVPDRRLYLLGCRWERENIYLRGP